MNFNQYLVKLLGKSGAKKLKKALRQNKTIIISGEPSSGKSTLATVLREKGYSAEESFNVYEIHLTERLGYMEKDFKDSIV